MLQLADQPQTTNEVRNVNYKIVDACLLAENNLRRDGWNMSFTSSANDRVTCNKKFEQTLSCNLVDEFFTVGGGKPPTPDQ